MLQSNMLQNDRTRALLDGVAPREQPEENGIGEAVNFALGFLRRQYWVIIFTAVLAGAASAIYLRITPPVYTAQVKVLFGNPKAQFVQQQSVLAADTPVDSAQLDSQIQILTSKAISISVINQLRLADDPEFKERGRLSRSFIREWLGGRDPARSVDPMDRLVNEFDKRLSAIRLGYSTVIEISFSAVVFPLPFGPSSTKASPAATSSETPCSASVAPDRSLPSQLNNAGRCRNRLLTELNRIALIFGRKN